LSTNVTVPSSLLDNVVQYVEASSMTAKRAIDEVEVHRQSQKRAADLRPPLLDFLVTSGLVRADQKEAAEAMLGSHAETMQLLKAACDRLVAMRNEKKAGVEPGQAVEPGQSQPGGERTPLALGGTEKQGSYNSFDDPVVGRKTNLVKESDRAFLALIGK
jgi:hypothetical protein